MSIITYLNLSLDCILGLCLMCYKSEASNVGPLIEICGDDIDSEMDLSIVKMKTVVKVLTAKKFAMTV